MINWLVDRMSVGETNRYVIREFRRRMRTKGDHPRWLGGFSERKKRHDIYRAALKRHNHNVIVYRAVMSGNFNLRCKAPCQYCGDE